MAIRVGRDSTTAADILLAGLDVVMGYANGRFAWTPAAWERFGNRPRVHIDVNGSAYHMAGDLDVETGDAAPGDAPIWVRDRHKMGASGHGATIYCQRSSLAAVTAALKSGGLAPGQDYTLWLADWTGDPAKAASLHASTPGCVAVQYKGQALTGAHYDESLVYDDAWHPVPVVAPPKPPSWQARALAQARAVVATLEAHQ